MGMPRFDHVGIVVDDLDASIRFFETLGLERAGEGEVEGAWVGRVIGLRDVHSQVVMLSTPDGNARVELAKFISPDSVTGDEDAPSNARGLRHITFEVDDAEATVRDLAGLGYGLVGEIEDYEGSYRTCYVRGPEGIIVEIAQQLADS